MRPTLPSHHMGVLQLTAAGVSAVEQAERLNLTVDAVKSRRTTLIHLFGAKDRAHLVALAHSAGVLDGEPVEVDWLEAADVPIGELIEARVARGWSQAQVARMLGFPPSWLCRRERGRVPFTIGVVRRYAELVGLDLDDAL